MKYLVAYLIGFASAVPIGPVAVLGIHQRMRHGFARGFSVVATGSGLDVVYFFLGVQAAGFVNEVIARYARPMRVAGGLILFAAAVGLYLESRRFDDSSFEKARLTKKARFSSPHLAAVFFYMTSPTILAFWLAVAGTAVANEWVRARHASVGVFAALCGAGSLTWYYILTRFILARAHRLKMSFVRAALSVLAVGLALFGGVSLAGAFHPGRTGEPRLLDKLKRAPRAPAPAGGWVRGGVPAQRLEAPVSGSQR